MHLNLVFVFLSACAIGPALSCRWMKHKFQHHHGESLNLIRSLGEQIIEDSENINPIPFHLISKNRNAEPVKRLGFMIQSLLEITELFEDAVSAPWDEQMLEDFVNVVHGEINGLRSCGEYGKKQNKKLHLYFSRLRKMVEQNQDSEVKHWEIIRTRVINLMDQLEFFSYV